MGVSREPGQCLGVRRRVRAVALRGAAEAPARGQGASADVVLLRLGAGGDAAEEAARHERIGGDARGCERVRGGAHHGDALARRRQNVSGEVEGLSVGEQHVGAAGGAVVRRTAAPVRGDTASGGE